MRKLFSLFSLFFFACSYAQESALDAFKEYLRDGTYEGQNWPASLPLSRYETFKAAFSDFVDRKGKVVVELGTSRSFVHGGLAGCNSDDPAFWTPDSPENWDWGAGFFTRMAAISLQHVHPQIYTVDVNPFHIQRCQIMTEEFKDFISYCVSSSEDFLQRCQFPEGIDLLYLDTGDMTPLEPTALLQLSEVKIIVERDLIAKRGLILIDDVKNQTPIKFGETSSLGKAKYSLPYLLDHGFEIVMNEYQVLLRKK